MREIRRGALSDGTRGITWYDRMMRFTGRWGISRTGDEWWRDGLCGRLLSFSRRCRIDLESTLIASNVLGHGLNKLDGKHCLPGTEPLSLTQRGYADPLPVKPSPIRASLVTKLGRRTQVGNFKVQTGHVFIVGEGLVRNFSPAEGFGLLRLNGEHFTAA